MPINSRPRHTHAHNLMRDEKQRSYLLWLWKEQWTDGGERPAEEEEHSPVKRDDHILFSNQRMQQRRFRFGFSFCFSLCLRISRTNVWKASSTPSRVFADVSTDGMP